MISFSPGPSQVYPEVGSYLQDAFAEGILSVSHRSDAFNSLSARTLQLIREKLAVPESYTILYTSSATECWEIIAQSLTRRASVHYSSGSFGDKWFQYAQALRPESRKVELALNEPLYADYLGLREGEDLVCLTQNETSNGTQIDFETLSAVRGACPDHLIALDCTSSMAGIALPFALGDIWFASVQKCFGMPAGLGLLILSPEAVQRAREIGDTRHYNSVLVMLEHIQKYQTSCTPNVLGIYLLNRILENRHRIEEIDGELRARMEAYRHLFSEGKFRPLITNEAVASVTVLSLEGKPEDVEAIRKKAREAGITLGAGYGKWKANTFRIANFPALGEQDIQKLQEFIQAEA